MIDLISPIPLQDANPIKTVALQPTTTTTTTTKPTLADKVSSWLDIGKEAAEIYTTVKNPQTGIQQSPGSYTPPPPPAQTNTLKYVLIGGAVLAAGFGIYAVLNSDKKKK